MTEHAGPVKKLLHGVRHHASNALIGGLILMLTGFTPEHLVVSVMERFHISGEHLRALTLGLDPRVLLVLFGVAIIVGDQLLRRSAVAPASAVPTQDTPIASTHFTSPSLQDRPSIAVLPFQNLSGDPEQEYFADGMVEEIITALSRIHWLFVIARNSCFTYKGRAVDVKQVGRELGVRYVLEGSVRKGGDKIRITGQLVDAGTGTHIWADRVEGGIEDV